MRSSLAAIEPRTADQSRACGHAPPDGRLLLQRRKGSGGGVDVPAGYRRDAISRFDALLHVGPFTRGHGSKRVGNCCVSTWRAHRSWEYTDQGEIEFAPTACVLNKDTTSRRIE